MSNQTLDSSTSSKIEVGEYPTAIAIPYDYSDFLDTVYVANYDSDSVSVISGENNTKIKDIPVGDSPIDIASHTNMVYVANGNNITVIDGNNKIIKDIPVGSTPDYLSGNEITPNFLSVNENLNRLYGFNGVNISVIDENTNTIHDIPLGPLGFLNLLSLCPLMMIT